LLIKLKEDNLFFLKLVLNDWSLKKFIKGIQKLELSNDGITIIETLGQDRSDSSLELLDLLSELIEVIIECSHLDVHDVIFGFTEIVDGSVELTVDLFETISKSSTFGVSDLDLVKLLELQNGVCKMHDVLASLKEAIKSDEQSVGGDLPLVLGLSLVVKVGIFEFVANFDSKSEVSVSLDGV
jgi:hypothetical protein